MPSPTPVINLGIQAIETRVTVMTSLIGGSGGGGGGGSTTLQAAGQQWPAGNN